LDKTRLAAPSVAPASGPRPTPICGGERAAGSTADSGRIPGGCVRLLGMFGVIHFLSCVGGLSGTDGRGTSRRDSGPGGDRAMPASACCLALSAEALRRLCGGVPMGGRPTLGRAAHPQESRLRSAAPLASRRGRSCRNPFIALRCLGRVARRLEQRGVRAGPAGSDEHRAPFPHLASMADLVDVPFVVYSAAHSAFALLLLSHSGGRGAYSRGAASLLFDWSRRPGSCL
jgi:hypothetical protein